MSCLLALFARSTAAAWQFMGNDLKASQCLQHPWLQPEQFLECLTEVDSGLASCPDGIMVPHLQALPGGS